jgi:hypothetical protein
MRTLQISIVGIAAAIALVAQTKTEAPAEPKPTAEIVKKNDGPALQMTAGRSVRQNPVTAAASPGRAAADPSLTNYELAKTFTVAAGQTVRVQSNSDWTGGNEVAISLNCASVANLRVYALWSVPNADFYSGTDILPGANFAFTNQGGGVVPVHGTQLMVQVRNTGTTDVSCDQIIIFGVVH